MQPLSLFLVDLVLLGGLCLTLNLLVSTGLYPSALEETKTLVQHPLDFLTNAINGSKKLTIFFRGP